MALEIHEEHVVPLAPPRGSRLDAGQAEAMTREWLEQPIERSRCVGVPDGDEKRGAVLAAWREELAPEHEKPRGVVRPILDFRGEHLQAVDFSGGLAGD